MIFFLIFIIAQILITVISISIASVITNTNKVKLSFTTTTTSNLLPSSCMQLLVRKVASVAKPAQSKWSLTWQGQMCSLLMSLRRQP